MGFARKYSHKHTRTIWTSFSQTVKTVPINSKVFVCHKQVGKKCQAIGCGKTVTVPPSSSSLSGREWSSSTLSNQNKYHVEHIDDKAKGTLTNPDIVANYVMAWGSWNMGVSNLGTKGPNLSAATIAEKDKVYGPQRVKAAHDLAEECLKQGSTSGQTTSKMKADMKAAMKAAIEEWCDPVFSSTLANDVDWT